MADVFVNRASNRLTVADLAIRVSTAQLVGRCASASRPPCATPSPENASKIVRAASVGLDAKPVSYRGIRTARFVAGWENRITDAKNSKTF